MTYKYQATSMKNLHYLFTSYEKETKVFFIDYQKNHAVNYKTFWKLSKAGAKFYRIMNKFVAMYSNRNNKNKQLEYWKVIDISFTANPTK